MRQRQAKKQKQSWEEGAVWYRLRYRQAEEMTAFLKKMSDARLGGCIALRQRIENGLTWLYVGVPQQQAVLMETHQQENGYLLTAQERVGEIQAGQKYSHAQTWPDQAYDAFILSGHLFINSDDRKGKIFPYPNGHEAYGWQMPQAKLGTTTEPNWEYDVPFLSQTAGKICVGMTQTMEPLHITNGTIIGDSGQLHGWLKKLLQANPQLAVVDNNQFAPSLTNNYTDFALYTHNKETSFNPLGLSAETVAWWFKEIHLPQPCWELLEKLLPTVSNCHELLEVLSTHPERGVSGVILTIWNELFNLNESHLLQGTSRPRVGEKRFVAYLPGYKEGIRQITRAVTAALFEQDQSLLLNQVQWLYQDSQRWREQSYLMVTGMAPFAEWLIVLKCRAGQADSFSRLMGKVQGGGEHALNLDSNEAIAIHRETGQGWRVWWPEVAE